MKAIIEIEMDNAAFGHGTETALELSQVLSRLGDNCEKYLVGNKYYIRTIRDIDPIEELVLKYTFYKVV